MRDIYFIRHGESMSQIDPASDKVNPGLSPQGQVQATELKERVSALACDLILVSPLRRAYQTLIGSGLTCDDMRIDNRLVESEFGELSFYDNVMLDAPDDGILPDESGSHHLEVGQRADSLASSLRQLGCQRIVLFGHWCVFMHLMSALLKDADAAKDLKKMENTAVSRIQIDDSDQLVVKYWNSMEQI